MAGGTSQTKLDRENRQIVDLDVLKRLDREWVTEVWIIEVRGKRGEGRESIDGE